MIILHLFFQLIKKKYFQLKLSRGFSFCFPNFCLSRNDNFVNDINDNYKEFSFDHELNNGSQYFKEIDSAIYQILFN